MLRIGILVAFLAACLVGSGSADSAWDAAGARADGKIVFERWREVEESDERSAIFVVRANGKGLRRLTRDSSYGASANDPSWSPDRRRIAYEQDLRICIMNADGRERTCLADSQGSQPTWSPDGRTVAYLPYATDWSKCHPRECVAFVGIGVSSNEKRVIRLAFPGRDLDWSPDGRRLAFSGYADGAYPSVHVVKVDGSSLARVTSPPPTASDESPRWSPDGRRLLFVREGSAVGSTVYSVGADGSRLRALLHKPQCCSLGEAAWSPTGSQFAYLDAGEIRAFDLTRRRARKLNLRVCAGVAQSCSSLDW